jgi:16S rRNA (guanine527-N7)-methyltransferase
MARLRDSQPTPLASDRAQALALTPVSRETLARLDRFVDLLQTWQNTTNLIARSTLPTLWTRHVADSLQLLDLAPDAQTWTDLGSGAGFPGLIIACALADRVGTRVHLVESNGKKAAFLREAVRVTGAPAVVHPGRIDRTVQTLAAATEIVTARAVAPLKTLLNWSAPLLTTGAMGLFPKGQDVEAELTEAARYWNMAATTIPSRTDPAGRIVKITALEVRKTAP